MSSEEALLNLLQTEAKCLQELLHAQESLQQSLIKGSAEEIRIQALSCDNRIRALESATTQRQDALSMLNYQQLDDAVEQCNDLRLRTRIKAFQQQIQQDLNKLSLQQVQNQALIEQGLNLTEETLHMLVNLQQQDKPAVYGERGQDASAWEQERSICDFNA